MIKYIPEIIQIVKEIVDFIHNLHKTNPEAADRLVLKLRDAVIAARHGDMSLLEALAKEVRAL